MIVQRFRDVTAAGGSFTRKPSATARSLISMISSSLFSSSTSVDDDKNTSRRRIILTLYRRFIGWCNGTDEDIPLSQTVPPIQLLPPLVDPGILKELAKKSTNKSSNVGEIDNGPMNSIQLVDNKYSDIFSPQTSVIKDTGITVHSISTSGDAKAIVKALFRMNSSTTNKLNQKKQVSVAFEWIRNLNELTQQLNEMKRKRTRHLDREGVNFRIGQIVKHRTLACRGVILGWSRSTNTNKGNKNSSLVDSRTTSLTKKAYKSFNSSLEDHNDEILYDIAVDWGDATLLSTSTKNASGLKSVYQSELMLVDDRDLMRIRSNTDQFQRFDSDLQCFVPGDVLAYVYPNDKPTDNDYNRSWKTYENPSNESAKNISLGIQSLAEHLRQIVLGFTSSSGSRNLRLLSGYFDRLTKLSKGDVVPTDEKFRGRLASYRNNKSRQKREESTNIQTKVKWELRKFVELAVEIEDILWARRNALETDRIIKFSLGEHVQHKKYGFRGVIVGWDPEPTYEVTHWDGLQHIENPEQFPFYHVIPDRSDIVVAFGEGRPWRYVCEENLELCPEDDRNLDIDLEPGWTTDLENGNYIPPDELSLRHGGDLEDEGLTRNCLEELKNTINFIFFSIRNESTGGFEDIDTNICAILEHISMKNMFKILKHAEDSETATVLSDAFKEIWKGHSDKNIRYKFDTGLNYLLAGNTVKALSIFGDVVDEDPTYAEAWNKAATCEFMMGNLDASMAAAQRTLEIMPDHFQALNGLGLVYNEKRDLLYARDNFRKSIELDPWSPVTPRLSVCLDTLKRSRQTSLCNIDEDSNEPEWKSPRKK